MLFTPVSRVTVSCGETSCIGLWETMSTAWRFSLGRSLTEGGGGTWRDETLLLGKATFMLGSAVGAQVLCGGLEAADRG